MLTKAGRVLTPCGPKQQSTGGCLVWEPVWEAAYGTGITQTVGEQGVYYKDCPKMFTDTTKGKSAPGIRDH